MRSVISSLTSRKGGRRSISTLLLAGTALCSVVALGAGIGAFVPEGQIAAVDLTAPKTQTSGITCLAGPTVGECLTLRGQEPTQDAATIGNPGLPHRPGRAPTGELTGGGSPGGGPRRQPGRRSVGGGPVGGGRDRPRHAGHPRPPAEPPAAHPPAARVIPERVRAASWVSAPAVATIVATAGWSARAWRRR